MTTTIETYQKKAWATAIFPNKDENFVYPILGLTDELGELKEAIDSDELINVKKELGDVFWYYSAICKIFNISFTYMHNHVLEKYFDNEITVELVNKVGVQCFINSAYASCSLLSGKAKKSMRDSQSLHTERNINLIKKIMIKIMFNLMAISQIKEISIEEALALNILKLSSREQRGVIKGDGDNR